MRVLRDGGEACTACTICTEGFGVKLRCDERSDTTCEACITGQTYRRNYFGVIKCLKCKACENRVVIKECTADSDRVCGACKPGKCVFFTLPYMCEPRYFKMVVQLEEVGALLKDFNGNFEINYFFSKKSNVTNW